MDAVAVIMDLNLKTASLIAGVAEHAFRRKAFQGMANKLGVGDPQGRKRMEQGFQNEHGFSLAARKRGMTA